MESGLFLKDKSYTAYEFLFEFMNSFTNNIFFKSYKN